MKRIKAAAVVTAALAGVAVATAPAQAHGAYVDISRNGCTYTGYSNHSYAYTEKESGSCAGHAWLRVRANNVISSWYHDPNWVLFIAASGTSVQVSDHKSCADCSYKNIRH
ncbi:hypothetical protein IAG44_40945 [Streptomyces roseirectus]|uniref:Uncharacterized protein n=1 Tax=Streptomyces roseirectus TaxID=2768066 RepID=A0A7H0IQT5_9ACTN|nr:hypothetical protein [Streptomyces roseirectus]QNP75151.1 hypothetical protein IAG44_40945 [Streptomyces roseirectus]